MRDYVRVIIFVLLLLLSYKTSVQKPQQTLNKLRQLNKQTKFIIRIFELTGSEINMLEIICIS